MSLSLIKCDFCKHLGKGYECSAFPEGIPLEDLSDDKDAECANGIKFEDERGEQGHKEIIPNPDSILEKMHWVSPRRDRE